MAGKLPPDWAYRPLGPADREAAAKAYREGTLRTNWHEVQGLRNWARHQRWPTPWLGFEARFHETMLADDTNFVLAVSESGLRLRAPKAEYRLTAAALGKFDAYYENPGDWKWLVESLREVRRAIEVGVVVRVEDRRLDDFDSFYTWAHGRYHALEDGADEWIGMD
jgi:hypothetical protein